MTMIFKIACKSTVFFAIVQIFSQKQKINLYVSKKSCNFARFIMDLLSKHIVTSLCLLFGTFYMRAAITPWNGSTKVVTPDGNVYSVSTAGELAWIAESSKTNDFTGKIVRLTEDIDLGGALGTPQKWTPIGTAALPFNGKFDGDNHVIYNMYILSSFPDGAGLFAQTGSDAEIHNLGIAQGKIMTDQTSNVGGIVGVNRGTIHHCFNMIQIIAQAGDSVGGLVGANYGTIRYAYNAGIITDANNDVGGLVGHNYSSAVLENCYNMGYCKGSNHVGALFGTNEAPESNLTKVFFDQQLTRMYATGHGAADPIMTDNTKYAIIKSETFINASPFAQDNEWEGTSAGHKSHPQLTCFKDHVASQTSVIAIWLAANSLPIMRAEGVGTPEEGNKPRNLFNLGQMDGDYKWDSPNPTTINIPSPTAHTAQVTRPCGNQEIVLTITYGEAVKQIYTNVKGYEPFDAGMVAGSWSVCWNASDVRFIDKNNGGKEAMGGKDDEQDHDNNSYQYMIIRDTITGYDENGWPNAYEPIDTFLMSQPSYMEWTMPTDVPGAYAFRRYVHDTQCKWEWTASKAKGEMGEEEGRLWLFVRLRLDPGDLYEEPDTIYGIPQMLPIKSYKDASGGGEQFEYVWKMEHAVLDIATQTWVPVEDDTREPLYIGSTKVSTASFDYNFTKPGEYTFSRKVSEATCQALPLECEHAHKVVVFEAIDPGEITAFSRELCTPYCADTIFEIAPVSGGNGQYSYRWLCNGEPVEDSDTTILMLENISMKHGETYIFTRQVKDDTGFMDWQTAKGEVKITIYSDYDAGAVKPFEEQKCLEAATIQEIDMAISSQREANGDGEFQYCWLLFRGGVDTLLLDTIKQNTPDLKHKISLSNYGLSVPVTVFVKRAVQNSLCLTEWKQSDNAAVWRLGRAEQHMTDITVCKNDLPYTGTYVFTDGIEKNYTFKAAGETVVMNDLTIEGCPKEVTLLCQVTEPPVVAIQPVVSVCQTADALHIVYDIQEGLPDHFDLTFSDKAKETGLKDSLNAPLPASDTIKITLSEDKPLGAYEFTIVFYAATAGAACKGAPITIPFSIDVDGYVHRKWNDVVFVDNSDKNCEPNCEEDKKFTSWQWYKDGEAIEGATGQSYYEQGGLNGFYRVQMTASDGTVYYSCLYEMRPTQGLDYTTENLEPIGDIQTFTIDGRPCCSPDMPGMYIQRWTDDNNQIHTRKRIVR